MYQLSTGEFLREMLKNTSIEKNILGNKLRRTNDELFLLIEKIISDHQYKNRIIFDGYPRNLNQANNLEKLLKKHNQKIDLVLKLNVTINKI